VTGFDVAYDTDSDLVAGAVVVLAAPGWKMIASATAVGQTAVPYVPGLLSFRELPPLLEVWPGRRLTPGRPARSAGARDRRTGRWAHL